MWCGLQSAARLPVGVALLLLAACSDLYFVHDPETGIIHRDQIPAFLKSVRCEVKTFISANDQRRGLYVAEIKKSNELYNRAHDRARAIQVWNAAVANLPHFLLAPDLFGGVYLDLKVVDTLGLPTGGSSSGTFNFKHVGDAAHTRTWLIAPTANSQNTYELTWPFLFEQNAGLSLAENPNEFSCYSGPPPLDESIGKPDFDGLASGKYSELQQFTRILVNYTTPLAAWLQENSTQLWANFRAPVPLEYAQNLGHKSTPNIETEQIIPVQMTYIFAVQISIGLDVKYSLVSPHWSPAQIDAGATSVQTNTLQITLNGPDAALAAGAKTGTAVDCVPDTGTPKPNAAPCVLVSDINSELRKQLQAKQRKLQEKIDKRKFELKSLDFKTDPQLNDLQSQKKTVDRKLNDLPPPAKVPVGPRIPGGRGYLLYPLPLQP